MILDHLDSADRYAALHPLFTKAFQFLRRTDLAKLPDGRHEIDGGRLYASIARGPGRKRDEGRLEIHRRYIDIQLVLGGCDEMGWRALSDCKTPEAEYNGDKDFRLFTDRPETWIAVPSGHFAIFFPHDAHAPMVSPGPIHKVVVKVEV